MLLCGQCRQASRKVIPPKRTNLKTTHDASPAPTAAEQTSGINVVDCGTLVHTDRAVSKGAFVWFASAGFFETLWSSALLAVVVPNRRFPATRGGYQPSERGILEVWVKVLRMLGGFKSQVQRG